MRKFGIGAITRAIGLIAIGAAIMATDVYFHRGNLIPVDRGSAARTVPLDPIACELTRCQAIGMAAKDDAACEATWAENRRRFFAPLWDHPPADAVPSSNARQPK